MTRTRATPKVQLMSAGSARSVILAACLLLLAGPGVIAHASANEIAEALAQCQDEDKAAELRARACTFLITTRSVEDNIRAEALLNRGAVQSEAGDTDAAIVDFTEAIRLNPQYPAPYSHRAESISGEGATGSRAGRSNDGHRPAAGRCRQLRRSRRGARSSRQSRQRHCRLQDGAEARSAQRSGARGLAQLGRAID